MTIPNVMPLSPKTTLSGSVAIGAVQATVTSAAVFPAAPFLAIITGEDNPDFSSWDVADYEVIEVKDVSGSTLKQIDRAVEGVAKAWPAGSWIMCGAVAELFRRIKVNSDQRYEEIKYLELSSIATNKDAQGVYKNIEWKRTNNTLYAKSMLVGNMPLYAQVKVDYYDEDGDVIIKTITWDLTYDSDKFPYKKEVI